MNEQQIAKTIKRQRLALEIRKHLTAERLSDAVEISHEDDESQPDWEWVVGWVADWLAQEMSEVDL